MEFLRSPSYWKPIGEYISSCALSIGVVLAIWHFIWHGFFWPIIFIAIAVAGLPAAFVVEARRWREARDDHGG